MFWLSLNSRNPRKCRTTCPDPRPPRHPCTRRPVSSEAPGRCSAPARRGRARINAGRTPRRRSPSPSVSSSSSSFLSPAVSRGCSGCFFSPGFGSRTCFSEPLTRLFDQVQVSENHVQPEFLFRRRLRGFDSIRPASILPPPPCPTRLPPSSDQVRKAVSRRPFSRSTTRSRPPVPLVFCSFRSWSESQVRFVVPFKFRSFSFRSSGPFCSASIQSSVHPVRSSPFCLFSVRSWLPVLSRF